jgi:hypothetical protein
MSIVNPIISGAVRSIKSLKGVLVIWISTLCLVCLVAIPLKSSMNSVLGLSMITEKLTDGINIDVFTDFGSNLRTILSSLASGVFYLLLFGFLLNVFFNGGIFSTLRNGEEKYSSSQFFRGAGKCSWPFLLITVVLSLFIITTGAVVFALTFWLIGTGNSAPEGGGLKVTLIGGIIFVAILPVFLLVVDYARTWQASSSKSAGFKAIGIGFNQTFRHFFSSYPVMFINMMIQVLFGWFVLKFLTGISPQTGIGIFLLFLLSQFLFIIRILLRVWRYGSVTYMYEKHPEKVTGSQV